MKIQKSILKLVVSCTKSILALVVACALTCFFYLSIGSVSLILDVGSNLSNDWDIPHSIVITGIMSAILASFISGVLAARLAPFAKVIHSIVVALFNGLVFLLLVDLNSPPEQSLVLPILLTILVIIATICGGVTLEHFQVKKSKKIELIN